MGVSCSTIAENSSVRDVSVTAYIVTHILKDHSVFEMSGTVFPPTECHIPVDVNLQCLCRSHTKEQHVCDKVCCVGKWCVDGLRPRRRVVCVSTVSAWSACNDQRIQKCEFWFSDWLVNGPLLLA